MSRLAWACLPSVIIASGCATAEASRDLAPQERASASSALVLDVDASPGGSDQHLVFGQEEAALRRAYVSSEMKLHSCATYADDGSVVGKQCPSALVVFGPYVTVPPNSDVKLRFNITAPRGLTITSDILSNGAKQFHGELNDVTILPNETRTVSYRVHVFDAVRALEARVGVRTNAPIDFTINNLELSVQ